MENNNLPSGTYLENLVTELSKGRELADQLRVHLNVDQSSSGEGCGFLLERILSSYDQALSILTHTRPGGEAPPPAAVPSDSQPSLVGSPHSDDSNQDFRDQDSSERKEVETWTIKITPLWPERGIEGQIHDRYNWRKYGQKKILGAKYPRGYYRCTYRRAQGCLATKRIQRSDDDPTIYEITYRRKHTCIPRASTTDNVNDPPTQIPDPQNEDPNPPLFNIQTSLRVINQDYLSTNEHTLFQPFDYPSSSAVNPENNQTISDNNNNLENNYPISTDDMNDNYGELIPNFSNLESELSLIVAPMTSTTNSSIVGSDFPFGSSGSESNTGFGDPGYYP